MRSKRLRKVPPVRTRSELAKSRAEQAAPELGRGSYALFRVVAQLQERTWGSRFSRKYPEIRMEILNRLEVRPGQLLVEVRMLGPGAENFSQEWREYAGVIEVETHRETDRNVLYRVTSETPSIHSITQRHLVLTRYPIVVQDGWSRFETFGHPAQIRHFLDDLKRQIGPNRVESVRQGSTSLRTLGLTPAQDAVFRAALSNGYFGAPRGISVTTLARALGRSKSTVSVTLAKIQQRLADSALQLDLTTTSLAP